MSLSRMGIVLGDLGLMSGIAGLLPLDAVSGSPVISAAYGTKSLSKAWANGNLFDVQSGGTHTIKAIGGQPDIASLATLMGISPTVGISGLLCSKWYDQNGANDATQATAANQPEVWLINGQVHMFFGGILSGKVGQPQQFFTLPAGFSFNNQSFSAFFLVSPYSTLVGFSGAPTGASSTLAQSVLFGNSGNPQISFPSTLFGSGSAPQGFLIDLSNFTIPTVSTPNFGLQKSVISAFGTASGAIFGVNETASTAGAMTVATVTGATLGAQPAGTNGFSGRMQCAIFSSTQFSTAQKTQMRSAVYALGGVHSAIASVVGANIVADGASIDQGQGGDPAGFYNTKNGGGYGWLELLKDQLEGNSVQFNNMAGSGNTIANCTANYAGMTSGCFNASALKNYMIGPNSAAYNSTNVSIGNRTGAQAYADFLLWLAAVKAQAWTRIFCLLYPAAGEGINYNNLMITNAAANGITLIDMTADPKLNTGIYVNADGHPTVAGYQVVLGYIYPVISALLP